MKAACVLYRIAAVIFVLFAAGHTVGFLSFRPSSTEGLAVWNAMNTVHFQARGETFSYGGWYKGFGLSITVSNLLQAVLAWHLAELVARSLEDAASALAWTFFAAQLGGLVLSWIWFGPVPVVLSAFTAVCLGSAAWLMQRQKA